MHELFLVAFGDAHQHHEKCQAIPGPPAEPADPPLAEARVDRDWSFQAQESGFEAHACDIHGSGAAHSQGIGRTKPPSKVTSRTGDITETAGSGLAVLREKPLLGDVGVQIISCSECI